MLTLSLGLALPQAAGQDEAEKTDRPNVVIIYTDDQSLDQMGCYGGQETPNIDKLAETGVRFTNYFVGTALCAPSRFGLQNGAFASTAPYNLNEYPAGGPINLGQHLGDAENRPPETWALPTAMKAAGYTTGFVGKYHLGFMGDRKKFGNMEGALDDEQMLADLMHNFKLAQEGCYAAGYDYAEALWHDNPQVNNFPGVVRYHNQDWITWKAKEFIQANQDEPFMLVVNPTLVHHPPTEESLKADRNVTPIGRVEIPEVQPSRESVLERQKAAGLEDNNHAGGVIWLDDAVGAIVEQLEELGLRENTVIFFVSDHSSRGKWTCYYGRSGAIVNWPGHIEPGRESNILAQNVDIAPTVWELCGVEPPADEAMQGISFARHLTEGAEGQREGAFMELFYQRAVISPDEWKYIAVRFPEEMREQIAEGKHFTLRGRETTADKKGKNGPAIPDELYNLKEDPHEKNNLVDDPAYAEKLAEMKELMKKKCRQLPHSFGEFTES